MRRLLVLLQVLCFLLIVACRGEAEEPTQPLDQIETGSQYACLDSSKVEVTIRSQPLPVDSTALNSVLWTQFINAPLTDQFDCLVWDASKRAPSFVRTLIGKAESLSLDSVSLEKCLTAVMADRGDLAYLPVSATSTTYGEVPVWVIVVKWEYADVSSREVLGHARVYVLAASDAKQLALETCS